MGSLPTEYDGEMQVDICILHSSNRPGKQKSKLKLSSERKARSMQYNMFMASALGGDTVLYVCSDKGYKYLTTVPTDNERFGCFMKGLRASVGERRRQDAAISITLMMQLQYILDA